LLFVSLVPAPNEVEWFEGTAILSGYEVKPDHKCLERSRPPGVSARLPASRKGVDRLRVAPIETFMLPRSRIGRHHPRYEPRCGPRPLPAEDPGAAAARIVELVKTRIPQRFGFDVMQELQVLRLDEPGRRKRPLALH